MAINGGAGAEAEIMEKVEPESEPKINNFGSATLQQTNNKTILSQVRKYMEQGTTLLYVKRQPHFRQEAAYFPPLYPLS